MHFSRLLRYATSKCTLFFHELKVVIKGGGANGEAKYEASQLIQKAQQSIENAQKVYVRGMVCVCVCVCVLGAPPSPPSSAD